MSNEEKFDCYAIVDVMGHQRYIGRVTEQVIAGTGFVRIDVPPVACEGRQLKPGWTKLVGTGSIYAISPITEELAMRMVADRDDAPISPYDLPSPTREKIPAIPYE